MIAVAVAVVIVFSISKATVAIAGEVSTPRFSARARVSCEGSAA